MDVCVFYGCMTLRVECRVYFYWALPCPMVESQRGERHAEIDASQECPKRLLVSLQQSSMQEAAELWGGEECWGWIRTDMERKKNTGRR